MFLIGGMIMFVVLGKKIKYEGKRRCFFVFDFYFYSLSFSFCLRQKCGLRNILMERNT